MKQIESAIVRIYTSDDELVGAGFLISNTHILTCTHVIHTALNLTEETNEIPSGEVFVNFPKVAPTERRTAVVKLWKPLRGDGGDITILELTSNPPSDVYPIKLSIPTNTYNTFQAYGFPKGYENGVIATGRLVGNQLVTNWVQIEDIKETGQRIRPGFSGSPVWDEQLNAVVGMIVAEDLDSSTKTAFMIPTNILMRDGLEDFILYNKTNNWKDEISDEYRNIVFDNSSTLRIIAGPGTGKTYSLIRRVARLLEENVEPHKILVVTFTRTAANDLSKELRNLKVVGIGQITCGTLHSFCFSILRKANVFLQTGRSAQNILLEFEKRFLLEDLKYNGSFGDYHERRGRLNAFEAAWAREQNQRPGWLNNPTDKEFDRELRNWLTFHDAMLIEEIIPETLRYLRDNPACPERSQFRHVLVDEYQDLNKAEQSLIDMLRDAGTLTIIGDEDQSIYEGFRYAHPEGIATFDVTHNGCRTYELSICRRCPKTILNIATNLIQSNKASIPRRLLPKPNAIDGEVHIVQWQNLEEESAGLANYIATHINSGMFKVGETLILCPRREFGWAIKEQLENQHQLLVRSFFQEDEFEGNPKDSAFTQQSFSLLNLANNLNDKIALRCWLGFDQAELNADQYKHLYDYCRSNQQSPRQALDALREKKISLGNTARLIKRYELLLSKLESFKAKTPKEIFNELFPANAEWAQQIRLFVDNLIDTSTLQDYIEAIRTGVTQPELPTEVNYIRVMSLHKSKGLTADNVIIMGCIEGLIPTLKQGLSPSDQERVLQEQRRLFYVAITRPRKTLVLSSVLTLPRTHIHKMGAQVIGGNKSVGNTITSRFVAELGPSCPIPINGRDWRY